MCVSKLNMFSHLNRYAGPILISDDDEEGNERESNGGHIESSKKKKPEFSFLLY